MTYILGGALLLAISGVAAATPLEFRGIPIGASEAEFAASQREFDCATVAAPYTALGDRQCSVSYESMSRKQIGNSGARSVNMDALNVGGAFAKNISAFFFRDRLLNVMVSVQPVDFDQVVGAIRTKYGKPTLAHDDIFVTRGGLRVASKSFVWKLSGGSIFAEQYGASLDESSIRFTSDAFPAASAANGRAAGAAGAGKL